MNKLLIELKGEGNYETSNIPRDELEIKAFNILEEKFFKKNKSFMLNLFYGRLKREYICHKGHIYTIKFNNFNTLILPHPIKSNNIIDLLNLYQEEKLINDTIFCEKCQSQVQYSIKTSIYNIPEYFILCLEKEFIYSSKGLEYPKILKTEKFMEKSCGNYILNSLIEYSGNRKAGNYIAKVSQNDKWYYISDGYYKEIDGTEINDDNAIILFYAKFD